MLSKIFLIYFQCFKNFDSKSVIVLGEKLEIREEVL